VEGREKKKKKKNLGHRSIAFGHDKAGHSVDGNGERKKRGGTRDKEGKKRGGCSSHCCVGPGINVRNIRKRGKGKERKKGGGEKGGKKSELSNR